ncbi:protein HEG homolog 1 isoform X3 [Sphaerodactylus townsendi]|uniref:protein HEG homolog 1 isoform X3 n=1 Tax=Sphaerodactylus townsendi TaxID=933632 RepID=UPI002026E222|nr:protein HEG homolog 1 isoform X3 [Sphaerodactylus townsendi]
MPATCTFLLHHLSLLLVVGLHLFVGSFPLDSRSSAASPSSSSFSTGSPRFATEGPRGSAVAALEGSSFAARGFLRRLERKTLEPSAASSGVWDPATEGRSGDPGIMSRRRAVDSSHTESGTYSFATDNADAFSIFGNTEGRTLRLITDSATVPTPAIGWTPSYPETVQSGGLGHDSSSVMQTRQADSPSNTLQIAELETVPLMTHLPHTPVSLLSEHNFSATGSSYHRDSSWDVETTTSNLHSESMDSSSYTVNKERTSQFLADSITLPDSTTEGPVSQMETTVSSNQTQFSSQTTQLRGRNTTSNFIQFQDSLARVALTHSYLSPNTAAEGGNQARSNSSTEQRIFSSQTDSMSVLDVSDRSEGRTLQTLTDMSHFHNATQTVISSGNETSSSLRRTHSSYLLTPEQTSGLNLSLGDSEFTETALVHSQAHSETTDVKTKHQTFSTSDTGEKDAQTDSTFSSVASIRDGNGTLDSLTNSSKFTETALLSTLGSEGVSSSDLAQYLSVTVEIGKNPSSSKEKHVTETSKESLLRYSPKSSIYSPSTIDLSSPGKSHQLVNVSELQGRISSASTDSLYLSTTFMHGAERTLRSLPDNSTFDASESSISNTEASSSSNPAQTLTSVAEAKEQNVSLSEGQFTEHSTDHLLELSSLVPVHSASPEDSSTVGIGHHRANSSSTERRALHSYTDTVYSSAPFSSGEEQTLQSVTNTTFTEVTERSSSYMEKSTASELNHSLSGVYFELTNFSGKDLEISGPSTETVQSFTSARTPTYSSFQSEPSDTRYDFQTMGSADTGKRSSASHTDSTYISTSFTKGGERTLLSISNNSTSFFAEISTPLESAQSTISITQNMGSNFSSSDGDFSAPSTEPLALQSLQTAGSSSTVSYSISASTSSSSLSFLPSKAPSLQSSIPPTQPPLLFSSPELSWTAFSSSPPTQLSSQTPLLTPSPKLLSTAQPTFPPLLSTLSAPASTSSPLHPSINLETSVSETVPEGTTDSSSVGSSTVEYNSQTRTYPLKDNPGFTSTGSSPLQTETTEQLTNHSAPVTISVGKTESSQEHNVPLPGTSAEETVPILTTFPTFLSESTTVSGGSVLPNTTRKDTFSLVVKVTTGKNLTNMTRTTLGLPTLASTTDYSVTTKSPKVQSPTEKSHTSGTTTKGLEMSSAPTVKVIEHPLSTTHPPKTFSSSKPTTRPLSTLPVPPKPTTVAWFGGPKAFTTKAFTTGKDIDECLSNPCPVLATCTNTQGSFQCTCSLGYQMEKGKCILVRTFVGQFPLNFNTTGEKYSELHQIEEDVINTLNNSLSTLPGYYTSTVQASRQLGTVQVSITSTFSVVSNVTLYDIVSTVRSHIQDCKASSKACQFVSSLHQLHRAGGLCKHKDPECDKETSACVDFDGIADCQCKPGYFRYNKLDHSCRACEDGYKLENDTCVSCPFGLGGFNCGNPYQLITIVIAAAGGGLLLILGIALIVTCCQKNKNDISKLIFKSGDFQMSPYAEYPKNPRAQDWGRENIEMQENGSTKNLLQMTDVYYMPTNLRNPELERNGLYPPYTGLPGTRHSCIYPGQYNPSFVSDDSRRRDYF